MPINTVEAADFKALKAALKLKGTQHIKLSADIMLVAGQRLSLAAGQVLNIGKYTLSLGADTGLFLHNPTCLAGKKGGRLVLAAGSALGNVNALVCDRGNVYTGDIRVTVGEAAAVPCDTALSAGEYVWNGGAMFEKAGGGVGSAFYDAPSGLKFRVLSEDAPDRKGTVAVVTDNYSQPFYQIPETVSRNDIEYAVTEIASMAFFGCTDLLGIKIPACLTNIGYYAFCHCTGLDSVIFSGITPPVLGEYAFYQAPVSI